MDTKRLKIIVFALYRMGGPRRYNVMIGAGSKPMDHRACYLCSCGWLGGVDAELRPRPYRYDLASGDKDKKTFRRARRVKVIAYLIAIELNLLSTGTYV